LTIHPLVGRLCCKDGLAELQATPSSGGIVHLIPSKIFFQSVDWQALYHRQVEMPYKPDLKDDTDLSSFETTFTREAPVDSVVEHGSGNDAANGGKSTKGRAFMNFFGMTGSSPTNQGAGAGATGEENVFKGFSFTKDEASIDEPSTTAADILSADE
jgi:hypothetical protein